MPIERGLIGKNINRVVMNMQAVCHLLDHDAAVCITDNPVQIRNAQTLACRLSHDHRVRKRCLNFVDRREVRRYPKRKLIRANVRGTVLGRGRKLSIPRKIKTCNSKARVVSAIKEHGIALIVDAHANHGMVRRRVIQKHIGHA